MDGRTGSFGVRIKTNEAMTYKGREFGECYNQICSEGKLHNKE